MANGKAVAMRLTPEQQARLAQAMKEWRIANYLDYQELRFGTPRVVALAQMPEQLR